MYYCGSASTMSCVHLLNITSTCYKRREEASVRVAVTSRGYILTCRLMTLRLFHAQPIWMSSTTKGSSPYFAIDGSTSTTTVNLEIHDYGGEVDYFHQFDCEQ